MNTLLSNKNINIVVISGDFCSGKSTLANLIMDDLNVIAKFNKQDFITRKLLYILGINPINVGYNISFISKIEENIQILNELNFLKDQINESGEVTFEHLTYFFRHCMFINDFTFDYIDNDIKRDILEKMNNFFKIPSNILSSKDLVHIYELTKKIYNIYNIFNDLSIDSNMQNYIDNELYLYRYLFNKKYVICYYAYSLSELKYFNNESCPFGNIKIFIDMDYYLRSQMAAVKYKEKFNDILKCMSGKKREKELKEMKKISNIVIKNNIDFDFRLKNKVINYLNQL